eukprot:CAMPEP_0197034410 /NCGR_PEP_ID=MMETSP1384-20130603/12540_1 /TAXON_ID=29189 /ORGANISM="Ammonia sp." /LENGTH=337 /DNA_ID=CAMNT_0042464341 /DNA_START=21 /DNA_END=1034 /DNA_ORIENTATION=-
MGTTCAPSSCCGGDETRIVINTEVKNPDWADAVQKNNYVAVKILHHGDPDCVNEPVDTTGFTALHYAVRNKNEELLTYLLENGANINAQGGKDRNSALHEAVLIADFTAVRKLFSYGINDNLTNAKGKTAIDLCNKKYKREFTKAKQFKQKHKNEYIQRQQEQLEQRASVMLAGMDLNDTNEKNIKNIKDYVKKTDHEQNFFRRKQQEIDERDMAITSFGDDCGIELDEIAMTIKDDDLTKYWTKLTKKNAKEPKEVTKQTEIYKILYGITQFALKKKNPRAKRPSADAVKKITSQFVKKLPKKRGKATLEREEFVKKMPKYLFELHDELVEREEKE